MLNEPNARGPLAVISFGWESLSFHTNWYNFGRKTPFSKMDKISQYSILRMRGARLNNASIQSDLAPAILIMLKKRVLQDEFYLSRLKNHYKQFRAKIDENYHRLREIPLPDKKYRYSGQKRKKSRNDSKHWR
jgi:hypothetical protein